MRKTLYIIMCLSCAVLARAQSFTYRYWIDQSEAAAQTFSAGSQVNFDLDISSLSEGLHELHVQALRDGQLSPAATAYFYVVKPHEISGSDVQCFYTIDGTTESLQAGTLSGGVYHFDIDASALADGLHNITTLLVAADGTTSQMQNAFFVKTPVGGNHIATYQYWVNDDTEHTTTMVVNGTDNPMERIELLNVAPQPVRSGSFHFEHLNGVPCVFAKNVLNFRFFDTAQRYVEGGTTEYIDYNAPCEVVGAGELMDGQAVTMDVPQTDGIVWFKATARSGELLRIKTDKACTIQLFSPSSEEVYCVQGSDALAYQDIRLGESGVYYLALHDVEDASAETVTLTNERVQAIDLYNGNADIISVIPNGSTKPAEATAPNAIFVANKKLADDDPLLKVGNVVYLDTNGEWTAKTITLTDAKPFYCPVDVKCEEIIYTRTFKKPTWQALYLPYNMCADDWSDIGRVARFSNIRQYDDDGDEVYERLVMEYELVKAGEELLPNVPYVIRPQEGKSYTFSSSDRMLKATPETDGVVDCSTTRFKYEMSGFYQPTKPGGSGNVYALNNDGAFQKIGASVTLTAFRLMLIISERTGNYSGSASASSLPAKIQIRVIGDETETGIESIVGAEEDESYYDLTGRKVSRPGRGVYVHKGKKVFIK